MHLKIIKLTSLCLVLFLAGCQSEKNLKILHNGHAHNDYEHEHPLFDALSNGFCSVEADVYLVDGRLLVAHDIEDVRQDRSLEELYLEPLKARIGKNGGRVYRNGPEFTLLIDIKSDAEKTYHVIHEVLSRYKGMLVTVKEDVEIPGPVRVIISGNRPRDTMLSQQLRYAGYDGRLSDLDSDSPSHFMPWISDSASKITKWRGEGSFPENDLQTLREITCKAHKFQRKVRLWATPDRPEVWNILKEANVDIIGADDLTGLAEYLTE